MNYTVLILLSSIVAILVIIITFNYGKKRQKELSVLASIKHQFDNSQLIPYITGPEVTEKWGFLPWTGDIFSGPISSNYFSVAKEYEEYSNYRLYLQGTELGIRFGSIIHVAGGVKEGVISYGLNQTQTPNNKVNWVPFTDTINHKPRLVFKDQFGIKKLIARKKTINKFEDIIPGFLTEDRLYFEGFDKRQIYDLNDILILTYQKI